MNLAPRLKQLEKRAALLLKNAAARNSRVDFSKYRSDPAAYCREVLHVTPTDQQQWVCDALVKYKWLLVPSANEVGKSFLQACLASWHYDCWNPSLTIVTAPSAEQIRDTVFAELRMLRGNDPNWLPSAMRLVDNAAHWIKGYTARHATAFHGRHIGGHVFVNFEEAEEIDQEFWVAADSMAHFFIAWYNPILTVAETVNRERSSKYHIVRLSAIEHPNVRAALRGDAPPVPNAITLDRVLDRLDKWATRLPDDEECLPTDVEIAGRKYRPGPIAEARVLGRRPSSSVGSVWSQELIDKLLATRVRCLESWPFALGVDVARDGDDFTCIHGRKGMCSVHHESHNGWKLPQTVERIENLLGSLTGNDRLARLVPVQIDDIGYGGGATDLLLAHGYNAVPVDSRRVCNPEYPNIRSQLWFDTVDLVRAGMADVSRLRAEDVTEICRQLLAPKYDYKTYSHTKSRHEGSLMTGRRYTGRCVEEKKKTKETLGRSPDDADAFNLCYYIPAPMTESIQ